MSWVNTYYFVKNIPRAFQPCLPPPPFGGRCHRFNAALA